LSGEGHDRAADPGGGEGARLVRAHRWGRRPGRGARGDALRVERARRPARARALAARHPRRPQRRAPSRRAGGAGGARALLDAGVIVARVRRSILERALLSRGERVLVACSGGPDSAALLHVLHRLAPSLGFELQAASVDHGLRPESAREVALAGELAHSLGVPFTPLSIEVPREGASLQAKARAARYAALLEQMKRIG